MSTAEMKSQIIEMLGGSVDESTLTKILRMLSKAEKKDWADEMPEEIEESLNRAIQQEKNGKVIPHNVIMTELKQEFPHLNL